MIVASNMQDAVLVDLAAKALPGVEVLFLETGYHFAETIGTRDAVEHVYDVKIVNAQARRSVAEQDIEFGKDLFARDPDLCCAHAQGRAAAPTPSRATTPGSPACAASRRRPGRARRWSPTTRSSGW